MSTLRFKAVEEASKRAPVEVASPGQLPSEYYGKYVFNRTQMSKYLSETMKIVLEAIDQVPPCTGRLPIMWQPG